MKKLIYILGLMVTLYVAYNVFVKTTHFTEEKKFFTYSKGTMSMDDLADALYTRKIIRDKLSFKLLAQLGGIASKTKSGKFIVKKNTSLFNLIRMLRNNNQATVKFILNKVRTRGELAKLVATTFDTDSSTAAQFFNNNDSLKAFQTDTTQLLTLFMPNTYEFYWSTSLPKFMEKMSAASANFWNTNDRKQKAIKKGMSMNEVYTLASIVEEETNYDSDKSLIASVYQNRLKKSMPLQACPTIKYAMQDFSLTRIYEKYLSNPSPYNTYNRKGLPPGPICTPAPKTIDLVLAAPNTNYIYFVAKADFSGYHHFSTTYEEHNKFAKEYQKQLDIYQKKKAEKHK
jgi:UPF0755 protein